MRYYQCDLQKGNAHTTAWIEETAAKERARVELKEWNEVWTVKKVWTPPIEYDDLKAKQERDRNCLSSLVGA